MTSTVTFTKLKREETITGDSITVKHTRYTDEELVALVKDKSPALFTVTEAHASQNLRQNYDYQEVGESVFLTAAEPEQKEKKKYASKSEEKRVRTQRVGKSNGSNDVSGT